MRCFSCDLDLGNDAPMDRPTKRFYCTICFQPTLEVQLAAASREIEWSRISQSETLYSYRGVADILEAEGWQAVRGVINFDLDDEPREDPYEGTVDYLS